MEIYPRPDWNGCCAKTRNCVGFGEVFGEGVGCIATVWGGDPYVIGSDDV